MIKNVCRFSRDSYITHQCTTDDHHNGRLITSAIRVICTIRFSDFILKFTISTAKIEHNCILSIFLLSLLNLAIQDPESSQGDLIEIIHEKKDENLAL